jgi:hypothetical protein
MTTPRATGSAAPAAVSTRTCLLAALPELALALCFGFALFRLFLPLMGPTVFGPLLQLEFLALAATLFMGVATLAEAQTAEQALGRRVLFWGIFAFFLLGALDSGVGIGFVAVMLATNVGVLLTRQPDTVAVQLVARSCVSFFLLVFCLLLAGQRDELAHWRATGATFLAGALYFTVLALLEMSGLFLRTLPRLFTRRPPDPAGDFGRTAAQFREFYAATGRQALRVLAWLHEFAGHR